jgi:hypothetical protein
MKQGRELNTMHQPPRKQPGFSSWREVAAEWLRFFAVVGELLVWCLVAGLILTAVRMVLQ